MISHIITMICSVLFCDYSNAHAQNMSQPEYFFFRKFSNENSYRITLLFDRIINNCKHVTRHINFDFCVADYLQKKC
jgi:hypothetical protein